MNRVFYDRKEAIVSYCKGKVVLDLGCTQHRMMGNEINEKEWLHWQIKQVAHELIGIDYLKDEVDRLNSIGYNIFCGNVEHIDRISLPLKHIDVIVCGELIEHLSNPGLFLDSVREVMQNMTMLIITTPNVYSLHRINLVLSGWYEDEWLNKEHKTWFSFETLKQLLCSHEFCEVDWGYYSHPLIQRSRLSLLKERVKRRINYKHINQVELEEGLFFVSKIKDEI